MPNPFFSRVITKTQKKHLLRMLAALLRILQKTQKVHNILKNAEMTFTQLPYLDNIRNPTYIMFIIKLVNQVLLMYFSL